MKKHFDTLLNYSPKEIENILETAKKLKKKNDPNLMKGKTMVTMFEAPSTRTQVSSQAAMMQLGGNVINLNIMSSQIMRGETLADTAKSLSLFCDCMMIRFLKHLSLEKVMENSKVPVINGMTDKFHPCQAMGDLLTLREVFGKLKGLKVAYVGDGGCNTAHSTMIGFSKMGIDVNIVCPKNPRYKPDPMIYNKALKQANAEINVLSDPKTGVKGADIIYVDVWVSEAFESEREERREVFPPYQVNEKLLQATGKKPKVMHCLPAFRGMEITGEVLDGKNSVVWQQAENRLHSLKGVLVYLLG